VSYRNYNNETVQVSTGMLAPGFGAGPGQVEAHSKKSAGAFSFQMPMAAQSVTAACGQPVCMPVNVIGTKKCAGRQ